MKYKILFVFSGVIMFCCSVVLAEECSVKDTVKHNFNKVTEVVYYNKKISELNQEILELKYALAQAKKENREMQAAIIDIAQKLGVKHHNNNINHLKFDINFKLEQFIYFPPKHLTAGELKDLKAYLCEEKKLFQKIKKYDEFIKQNQGKRLIEVP